MNDTISRQDAINLLKKWSDGYKYIETETELAIKEFQHLPSAPTVEERPSANNKFFICDRKRCERCSPDCYITSDMNHRVRTDTVVFIDGNRVVIKSEEIKYPRWINLGHLGRSGDHPYSVWYKCSECGYEQYWWTTEKCPYCGARMER